MADLHDAKAEMKQVDDEPITRAEAERIAAYLGCSVDELVVDGEVEEVEEEEEEVDWEEVASSALSLLEDCRMLLAEIVDPKYKGHLVAFNLRQAQKLTVEVDEFLGEYDSE